MNDPSSDIVPRFNTVGTATLLKKEVHRFAKVWLQTVLSPLVTTSLYFLVFGLALGSRLEEIDGVPYIEYVIPGLIMLAMISNAFLNSSSSLFQSKVNGTSVDIMVAPLSASEILFAYVIASILRGHAVGLMVWLVSSVFVGFSVHSVPWTLFFTVSVSATFGGFGVIIALWAQKFDHLAVVPNFVLTPMTFLGGVFYSVEMLPEPWSTVSRFNPVLYMVNGMRHGLLGISDVSPWTSGIALLILLAAVLLAAHRTLASGARFRL